MTLSVHGSDDGAIAARLAGHDGIRHHVFDLDGVGALTPDEAHLLAVRAARRLQCAADPLALVSLAVAEADLGGITRLSGLGGEVVRGFYYFGPTTRAPVTPTRVRRLATWRLFPNQRIEDAALLPGEKAAWQETVTRHLIEIFHRYGSEWNGATDEFYLHQRMHRWAGVLASAICMDRIVVNPMLDTRFVDLGRSLPPRAKAGSRYLSQILWELDPDLARVPLDGRPAPVVYAHPTPANRARMALLTGRKVAGKISQRARSVVRAPAGGEVVGALVLAKWRECPELLGPALTFGLVSDQWVSTVLEGRVTPSPASIAFLVNLEVLAEAAHR